MKVRDLLVLVVALLVAVFALPLPALAEAGGFCGGTECPSSLRWERAESFLGVYLGNKENVERAILHNLRAGGIPFRALLDNDQRVYGIIGGVSIDFRPRYQRENGGDPNVSFFPKDSVFWEGVPVRCIEYRCESNCRWLMRTSDGEEYDLAGVDFPDLK